MLLEQLRVKSEPEEWEEGQRLYDANRVLLISETDTAAVLRVLEGDSAFQAEVTASGVRCPCGVPCCRHAAAAVMYLEYSGSLSRIEQHWSVFSGAAFSEACRKVSGGRNALLRPVLARTESGFFLAILAGEIRPYSVRLDELIRSREQGRPYPDAKVSPSGEELRFDDQGEKLLRRVERWMRDQRAGTVRGSKYLVLNDGILEDALDTIGSMEYELRWHRARRTLRGFPQWEKPLDFAVSGSFLSARLETQLPEEWQLVCGGNYLWAEETLWHVAPRDRYLFQALDSVRTPAGLAVGIFARENAGTLFNEIIPWLERRHHVEMIPALKNLLTRFQLAAEVYLDVEGKNITARVVFHYGQYALDPFGRSRQIPVYLLRDTGGEKQVLDLLFNAGFRVFRGNAVLSEPDAIFAFLTGQAERLKEVCTVYMSRDFQRVTPRRAHLHGVMRTVGNRLRLELMDSEVPIPLLPIMEALENRRRYFRLEDGSFLLLEEMGSWEPFAQAVMESAARERRGETFAAYRASWFDALIREGNLPWKMNDAARKLAQVRCEVPEPALEGLRPYQATGTKWMLTLHALGMGGILADEMGLGKTVEAIALLYEAGRDEQEKLPSLVIAPTSLLYNWHAELGRFAPSLRSVILTGSREERQRLVESSLNGDMPDVIITSYPLVRRDIPLLEKISYRFVILDEAQQVKNVRTLIAGAVRRLRSSTRFVMTGTPMENHIGELWSLFDFVMPGFLPDYIPFMRRWGDGRDTQSLLVRIRPFFLRRLKQDVLEELPPRQEKVFLAEMTRDQAQVYQAALYQKQRRVRDVLRQKGMRGSRGDILRAITELREICCHPALCLRDYRGGSGKMDLLLEQLRKAVAAHRRVLVFSQFKTMLSILRQRLTGEGFGVLYLDGDTPSRERAELTERFNAGEGDVFLISLRAGGTGLNLTGADIVIHYEPWWNPNVEDQADARAHRIGQVHPVEVWKLITQNTIEEKILALGEKKKDLFNRLITPGEVFPDRLTEEELLALFDGAQDGGD